MGTEQEKLFLKESGGKIGDLSKAIEDKGGRVVSYDGTLIIVEWTEKQKGKLSKIVAEFCKSDAEILGNE